MQVLPKFRSKKVVEAVKIRRIERLEDESGRCFLHYGDNHGDHLVVSVDYMNRHDPQVGGYHVRYRDGHEGWSPADAFESAYAAIGYVAIEADKAPGPAPGAGIEQTQPAITGYRTLSQTEIDLINEGSLIPLDELMEAITLVQTGKSRKIPIILVGKAFWAGLLDWLKNSLVAEGMANQADLDLIQLIDEPAAIVEAIFKHYESTGFELTPAERKAQLYL